MFCVLFCWIGNCSERRIFEKKMRMIYKWWCRIDDSSVFVLTVDNSPVFHLLQIIHFDYWIGKKIDTAEESKNNGREQHRWECTLESILNQITSMYPTLLYPKKNLWETHTHTYLYVQATSHQLRQREFLLLWEYFSLFFDSMLELDCSLRWKLALPILSFRTCLNEFLLPKCWCGCVFRQVDWLIWFNWLIYHHRRWYSSFWKGLLVVQNFKL